MGLTFLETLDRRAALSGGLAAVVAYKIMKAAPRPVPFQPNIPRQTRGLKALILGHLVDMMGQEAFKWHYEVKEKYPFPAPLPHRFFVFNRLALMAPGDIQYVLSNVDHNMKKPKTYEKLAFAIGKGLVCLVDDAEHDAHRRYVSSAFSPKALKTVANETVQSEAMRLINVLTEVSERKDSKDRSIKIQKCLNGITLNIIADAAFNTTASEKAELAESLRGSLSSMGLTITLPGGKYLPTEGNRSIRQRNKVLLKATNQIISRTQKQPKPEDGQGKALIEYLVFNDKLTSSAITEHCITFVFAGYETTSTALTWMAYCLSKNPKCQEKLYEEFAASVARRTCSTVDELKNCKYARCVILETMRLFPPVPHINREAKEDLVLPESKTFVPKGTMLPLSIYFVHRAKEVWGPDAEEFRPERWEEDPELEEKMTARGAYLPFSFGRRNCIGKDFAMNEMLLLSCAIYRNFRFSLTEGQNPLERKVAITMSPKHALAIDVEARDQ